MIALVATRPLVYGDLSLGAGERFDATPIDAAVLTYRRHAAFAPRGPIAPQPPAPRVEPVCLGDDETSAVERLTEHGEDDAPPVKRKRTYKRRDLQAEE